MPPRSTEDNSSSSSDEDENIAMLRAATDPTLITDDMFKNVGTSKASDDSPRKVTTLKSQRNIDHEECNGGDHKDHFNVSESMQAFVYKKMSTILSANIEFVTVDDNFNTAATSPSCVKLFRDTEPIRLESDADAHQPEAPRRIVRLKRRRSNKKQIDPNVSEADKIQASLIDQRQISSETSAWKDRTKKEARNLYRYRDVNSKLYLVEADNEFTKLRKKNNWTENRIARK